MSRFIHLGDHSNHQSHDQIKFYSPGSSYGYTIEVYHPIHTIHLREQWRPEDYELLDTLWKKLLELYAKHRQDGMEHTCTKMLARHSSLVVLLGEMLGSGVEVSVTSGVEKSEEDWG
jgi:hypothetical protein